MSSMHLSKKQVTGATFGVFAIALLGVVGCGDLGIGTSPPSTVPVPEAGGADVGNGAVLASLTLRDGSRVEFVDVDGNVMVTAEFDSKTADPLATLNDDRTRVVALYESLAGTPAPQALVDAEQRLKAAGEQAIGPEMPGTVVEEKSGPESGDAISMSARLFENLFCSVSGFCLTNRHVGVTAIRPLVMSTHGVVDCVAGKVTATVSERTLGLGSFGVRSLHDVNAGSTFKFVFLYLVPTDVRVRVVPQSSVTYHLAFV
jgi:hypothetical protein